MNNILFIIYTLGILIKHMSCYLFGISKMKCFMNAIKQLGEINIFYVKLFQTLSTNTYILDQEQITYLSSYTDNVPYSEEELDYSFIETIKHVSKIHNHSFEIDRIDNMVIPYRSGMIAVVYTGKINGEKVVIKVIRKGIFKKLNMALENVNFIINLLGYIPYIKIFNLNDIVSENREELLSQTNFKNELSNIKRMSYNCKNTDYIVIPDVYEEYTHENDNIIVMKFIEGNRLENIIDSDKDEYSFLVANFGIKCFLFNRFYHGDLHSGNILFIKKDGKYKLGILDFGICGELTRDEQDKFYRLFTLMGKSEDFIDVSEFFINNFISPKEKIDNLNIIDKTKIIDKLSYILKSTFTKGGAGAMDLYNISKFIYTFDLCLDRDFCRIEVALTVADSVSANLYYKSSYLNNLKKVIGGLTNIIEY